MPATQHPSGSVLACCRYEIDLGACEDERLIEALVGGSSKWDICGDTNREVQGILQKALGEVGQVQALD